jgi:hypothetical protein
MAIGATNSDLVTSSNELELNDDFKKFFLTPADVRHSFFLSFFFTTSQREQQSLSLSLPSGRRRDRNLTQNI